MWLKIIGSLIILIAGTGAGLTLAAYYRERPRQIRHMIGCLASLKSYINYAYIPLPEALMKCTHGFEGPVAIFFREVGILLKHQGWISPQEAMITVFHQCNHLALGKPEIELLTVLGANLGRTNREEQEKYLEMIQDELHKIEEDAILLRNQNTKMSCYLGICGSLAVIILLF